MASGSVQFVKRLMVFALICETISATYMLSFPSLIGVATILYALAGITIGIGFLFLPAFKTLRFHPQHINHHKALYWYKKAFLVLLGILAVTFSVQWMEDAPMDYHDADMLPIMKIMCERFIAGKGPHVYDIIPEIWKGIQPVYFPAMWMPYCRCIVLCIVTSGKASDTEFNHDLLCIHYPVVDTYFRSIGHHPLYRRRYRYILLQPAGSSTILR